MSQNETTATSPPENFHLVRLRAKIEALRKQRAAEAKQRAELALKFKPLLAIAAEKRMKAGKANPTQKSAEGETRDDLARAAGVSREVEKINRPEPPEAREEIPKVGVTHALFVGSVSESARWLAELLSQGEVPSREVFRRGREAGYCKRTLWRAARTLFVKRSLRDGKSLCWSLPKGLAFMGRAPRVQYPFCGEVS